MEWNELPTEKSRPNKRYLMTKRNKWCNMYIMIKTIPTKELQDRRIKKV